MYVMYYDNFPADDGMFPPDKKEFFISMYSLHMPVPIWLYSDTKKTAECDHLNFRSQVVSR